MCFNSATKSTNGSRLSELKPKLIANSIRQIPLLICATGWYVIHLKLEDVPMDKGTKWKAFGLNGRVLFE